MKERPILFSGAMVRAILDGRKSQTRRVIKDFAIKRLSNRHEFATSGPHQLSMKETPGYAYVELDSGALVGLPCPYGQPGDRLWVREAFAVQQALWEMNHGPQPVHYLADSPKEQIEDYTGKPSIHMPRWASRITLEITGVRVERLQEISEADALAEGTAPSIVGRAFDHMKYRAGFQTLWDSINAARGYGWEVNPWVWVIEFRRMS